MFSSMPRMPTPMGANIARVSLPPADMNGPNATSSQWVLSKPVAGRRQSLPAGDHVRLLPLSFCGKGLIFAWDLGFAGFRVPPGRVLTPTKARPQAASRFR